MEPQDIQTRRLSVSVVRKEALGSDIIRLFLQLPASETLQYFPGQYIDVLWHDDSRRSYSIANALKNSGLLELHIRRVDGGDQTDYMFDELKVQDRFDIEGPYGEFYLREDSGRPVIFVAGGTGFAPIKAIIEYAIDIGLDRPMHLYWGARTTPGLYLHELVQRWQQQGHVHYTPVLSEPEAQDDWQGRCGFVHEAVIEDFPELRACDVYVNGPPAMVVAARKAFFDCGLPAQQFYSDYYEVEDVISNGSSNARLA